MADQLQLRGGTTSEHSTFTGALREITVDTTKKTLVVHDAATAGGIPLARQDLNNVTLPAGSTSVAGILQLTNSTSSTSTTTAATPNSVKTAYDLAAAAAPLNSPTFTGTVTIPAGASISGYLTTSTASSTYAPQASPTFTGSPYVNGSYRGNITAVAALDIDCSLGNYFTKTINGASTFTVSNVPASRAYAFTLELTHTSGTVTWFSGVEWPAGTAPTLTTGKTHLFMFVTDDGGTRWRASSLINYTN